METIPLLLIKLDVNDIKKARYGQKERFSTVINRAVFKSIQCDPCCPLTFIFAHATKTTSNQWLIPARITTNRSMRSGFICFSDRRVWDLFNPSEFRTLIGEPLIHQNFGVACYLWITLHNNMCRIYRTRFPPLCLWAVWLINEVPWLVSRKTTCGVCKCGTKTARLGKKKRTSF